MDNQRQKLRRYQFSLLSILIGTTIFAVILSFTRVVGFGNAIRPLWHSFLIAMFIWTLSLVLKESRKWNRFFPVMIHAILGTIFAGFLCLYINKLNPEIIDLSEHWKFASKEARVFNSWVGWGGLIGPIVGIVHSWLRYKSGDSPITSDGGNDT